ncbi:MAG: GNAT family N-acetyltransferase [Anaerolineales bacterium]|nr:GNAT family N-acetyltransferase [Anaerolineae bacterium]PWB54666.1 MAG: GNAT family N-acetyltransferase [Anaerolineales bacterium]
MRSIRVILNRRAYQSEEDFWRIRNFLRQVSLTNDHHMFSWPVIRLDYWRWHGIRNLGDGSLERDVIIWETEDQQIAAALNPEERGQVFLQVHPSHKSSELEDEMVAYAEAHLQAPSRRGGQVIWIWSDSNDSQRQAILQARGFIPIHNATEHQWRRSLVLPLPQRSISDGYIIRPLGDVSELPSRSWASWRAFHPDEPDEKYDPDWSWYQNIQAAPLYRSDLDLVAVAPTGDVAAFTTIWYDDETNCGYFEPVGTVPEHQRRGIASALCCEGLRRLKGAGATFAMVVGGTVHANALYRSVFGPEFDLSVPWEKRWD